MFSVLSVASTSSILSIGSRGCTFGVLDNYALWEIEQEQTGANGMQDKDRKKGDGVNKNSTNVPNLIDPPQDIFGDTGDMISYFIGEKLTAHFDGACARKAKNNYYLFSGGAKGRMRPFGSRCLKDTDRGWYLPTPI